MWNFWKDGEQGILSKMKQDAADLAGPSLLTSSYRVMGWSSSWSTCLVTYNGTCVIEFTCEHNGPVAALITRCPGGWTDPQLVLRSFVRSVHAQDKQKKLWKPATCSLCFPSTQITLVAETGNKSWLLMASEGEAGMEDQTHRSTLSPDPRGQNVATRCWGYDGGSLYHSSSQSVCVCVCVQQNK